MGDSLLSFTDGISGSCGNWNACDPQKAAVTFFLLCGRFLAGLIVWAYTIRMLVRRFPVVIMVFSCRMIPVPATGIGAAGMRKRCAEQQKKGQQHEQNSAQCHHPFFSVLVYVSRWFNTSHCYLRAPTNSFGKIGSTYLQARQHRQ